MKRSASINYPLRRYTKKIKGDLPMKKEKPKAKQKTKPKRKRKSRIKYLILLLFMAIAVFIIYSIATYHLPVYSYESSDRGMAEMEAPLKGRTLDVIEARFAKYKQWKSQDDLRLYRTSKRTWSVPLLWLDGLTHRRCVIPYMEPSTNPKYKYYEEMEQQPQNRK
jgi:hypothetical protein